VFSRWSARWRERKLARRARLQPAR